MEASISRYSPAAVADMAATLSQSAAMVTCIAAQKVSIEGSNWCVQDGELALVKKENESSNNHDDS